jgi:hypothetical protein
MSRVPSDKWLAGGAEEGTNRYLYDAPRACSGTGTATRSEETDAKETETQTVPSMPGGGIGTDMRGVGGETERRRGRGSGIGRVIESSLQSSNELSYEVLHIDDEHAHPGSMQRGEGDCLVQGGTRQSESLPSLSIETGCMSSFEARNAMVGIVDGDGCDSTCNIERGYECMHYEQPITAVKVL